MTMIVCGIDPGLADTGYGVVQRLGGRTVALDGGCIRTPPQLPTSARLARIFARLGEVLDEHAPEAVALESLYFGVNVRTATAVGQARGVALLAAGVRSIPCHDYTPQQVKGAVCGSGAAGKAQVQRMVQALLALPAPPRPNHAADALAVAICHANGAPLKRATEDRREPIRSGRAGGPTTPSERGAGCPAEVTR